MARSYAYSSKEADLAELQSALEDIWTTLQAHDPDRDWDGEEDLKAAIAEKLMTLVATGIRKPDELRRRGLETLPLNWGPGFKKHVASSRSARN